MTEILPLYHFFERLRQNDFTLGVGEYEKFLYALERTIGIKVSDYTTFVNTLLQRSSVDEALNIFPKLQLLSLCKLLWLKPNQSALRFEELFEESYFLDFQGAQEGIPAKPVEKFTRPVAPVSVNEKLISTNTREAKDEASIAQQQTTNALNNDGTSRSQTIYVRVAMGEHAPERGLQLENKHIEVENSKFLFTPHYFPIDRRKMQQNLRLFPSFRHDRSLAEIDMDATIQNAVDKGFFNQIVYQKQKSNSSNLLLLIDHHGSMVAFEQLANNIKAELEHILGSNKAQKNNTFSTLYFYNLPGEHLFVNKTHTKAKRINEVLNQLKATSASIILISDAGAARSNRNYERVLSTTKFLAQLRNCTNKIAWLNPMPKKRWRNTTAQHIATSVAMFEITESGIKSAVDFLKGASSKIIKLT